MTPPDPSLRAARGKRAHRSGLNAEALACAALERDGWTLRARRIRTAAGEVDAVAEKDGLLAFIEIKQRSGLIEAAFALGHRQRERLIAAAEILLAENPGWGQVGIRFDVLLVDRNGTIRRITDAFRAEK